MTTHPGGDRETRPTPTAPPRRDPGPRRGRGDVVAAALLAAVLASGGTYAAVRVADDGGIGGTVSTPADAPAVEADTGTGDTGATARPVVLTGEQDWSSVAQTVSPSVVSITTPDGAGSGVVWDGEGHVVTNAHVVEGSTLVGVTLADGRGYQAEVVGSDPSSDLAVLRLDQEVDLPPIAVGDDSTLVVGDPVMAVGNPLGLSGTVTTGIVSALDRPVSTQGSSGRGGGTATAPVVTNAIQTSAAINPGNSGGALVNAAGELVGINSSIAALPSALGGTSGSIGIGFAIPSAKVQLIVDQLIETGTATHAFLGVELSDGQAEVDGAVRTGAQVQQVEPDSPAARAGLARGDLIVGIDGEPVSGATALVGQVRERATGQQGTVQYVRDGAAAEVAVTFATRPDQG